jgi:voltage-gated potassium channel Kch
MTALGGGAAFAAVEGLSTWDGVYWAVTTMTTVGYGDVTSATDGGRPIAILVMVVGIGLLTMSSELCPSASSPLSFRRLPSPKRKSPRPRPRCLVS